MRSNVKRHLSRAISKFVERNPGILHSAADVEGSVLRRLRKRGATAPWEYANRAGLAASLVQTELSRLQPLIFRFSEALTPSAGALAAASAARPAHQALNAVQRKRIVDAAVRKAWFEFEVSGGRRSAAQILARHLQTSLSLSALVVGITERNDVKAFDALLTRLDRVIKCRLYALLPDADPLVAEDIRERTLEAVWMNLSIERAPTLIAFARKIVTRRCVDYARRKPGVSFETLRDDLPIASDDTGPDTGEVSEIAHILSWLFNTSEHVGHVLTMAWSLSDSRRPPFKPKELGFILGGLTPAEALELWTEDFHAATSVPVAEIRSWSEPFRVRLPHGITLRQLAGRDLSAALRNWASRGRAVIKAAAATGAIRIPSSLHQSLRPAA